MHNTASWSEGSIVWEVPFGWNEYGTIGEVEPVETFARDIRQEFVLHSDGSAGIRKLNNQVIRSTNDVHTLNGVIVP